MQANLKAELLLVKSYLSVCRLLQRCLFGSSAQIGPLFERDQSQVCVTI